MQRHYEGGIYRDELAEICSNILRATGFRGAARFRINTVPLIYRILLKSGHFIWSSDIEIYYYLFDSFNSGDAFKGDILLALYYRSIRPFA